MELKPTLQDYAQRLAQQRNDALDDAVNAHAMLAAAVRRIADLESRIAAFETTERVTDKTTQTEGAQNG